MVFTSENHFQLVRIFFMATSYFLHEWDWRVLGVCKTQHWDPIFWIPLDSLFNYSSSRTSWFSRWKTISNSYVSLFWPLPSLFMSGNGEYRRCVKYSIEVQFHRSPWIHCVNYFWSIKLWFSRWKTIFNLHVSWFLPIRSLIMSGHGKYWGGEEILLWYPILWIPWDSLRKLFLKYKMMVFTSENHFQLVRIFFMATSYSFHECEWQIPGCVKYSIRVLFSGSPWIH